MAPHAVQPEQSFTDPTSQYSQDAEDGSLQVIIIGAGIAGLSAAIGLRRAGCSVSIFEQSEFANEVGAAIHLCPNASRILLQWGIDPIRLRFDETRSGLTANAGDLTPLYEANYDQIPERYGAPWYLSHRVDLHNGLKELATRKSGKREGVPAKIHLKSKVVAIVRSRQKGTRAKRGLISLTYLG